MHKFILMTTMPLLTLLTARGATETIGDYTWTYQINDGGAFISSASTSCAVSPNPIGSLAIPSKLGTCPVTGIGPYAFYRCSGLTDVTIPSSVTNIGSYAFSECSGLTSMTIPPSVTGIGSYAFCECTGLTEVTIPSSVTSIDECAFFDCRGLTSVTIPSSVTNIGLFAFAKCSGLTEVTIPTNVTSLADAVFAYCSGMTSVTIPSSVTNIGTSTFYGCSGLTEVTIPASVTCIGGHAFEGCTNLVSLTFDGFLPQTLDDIFGNDVVPFTLVVHAKQEADLRYWQRARILFDVPGRIGESGGTSGTTQTTAVCLTVTNVIVHYVTNSKTSESAIPDTMAGIVNIVAEIDSSKALAITEDWAEQYPDFARMFGSDFSKALMMPTGKKDGAGNAMLVWQDYVAGTDPTKKDDVFTASITFDKETGKPVISWSPELTATETAKREYKKFGKVKLTDEWEEISDAEAENYNFFKVTVGMK